jgi:hypothetical protein
VNSKFKCFALEVFAWHHFVHHANEFSFVGSDGEAGVEQFLGAACAEFPYVGEELMAIHTKHHNGVGEGCIARCHDEVAWPYEHEPTGNHLALHFSNGGFRNIAPAPAHAQIDFCFHGHVTLGAR